MKGGGNSGAWRRLTPAERRVLAQIRAGKVDKIGKKPAVRNRKGKDKRRGK